MADAAKTGRTVDRIVDGAQAAKAMNSVVDGAKAAETFGDVVDVAKSGNMLTDTVTAAKTVENAGDSIDIARNATVFGDFPAKIHDGRQGKHIKGHNNYIEGRSIINLPNDRLQTLIKQKSGTGMRRGNKEIVDFGEIIGEFVDVNTGKTYKTTMGTIHYSGAGVHVVPARPKK